MVCCCLSYGKKSLHGYRSRRPWHEENVALDSWTKIFKDDVDFLSENTTG